MRQSIVIRCAVIVSMYAVLWALTAVVGTRQLEDEFIASRMSDPIWSDVDFQVTREDGAVEARNVADSHPVFRASAYSPLPFVIVLDHSESLGWLWGSGWRTTSFWCGVTREIKSRMTWIS